MWDGLCLGLMVGCGLGYLICIVQWTLDDAEKFNYREYLQSPEWKALRLQVLKRDNYTCQYEGCTVRSERGMHVHHLTYKRIGREKLDDLITLCKDHHVKVEDKVKKARQKI